MNTRTVISAEDAQKLGQLITGLPLPFTLTWREGAKRTRDQNALAHVWFRDIARHFGDRTAMQVKGECNVDFGLPIRLRDAAFAWVWERSGATLPHEKQCRLLALDDPVLAMTSAMTTKELSEYMDAMSAHYRAQGVHLTDPEGA